MTHMDQSLAGQVALISGGSGGIGGAAAIMLAAAGAKVGIHYHHNADGAQDVLNAIEQQGGAAFMVQGDLGQAEACAAVTQAVVGHFGRLDILVNCSGTAPQMPFGSVTPENFTRLMSDNVLSAILMMQEAVKAFPAEGGRIVNVASNLSYGPMPGLVPYCAAKSAIITLTQGYARELAGRNIAVNAVAPGATETAMTAWISDDIRAQIAGATPLGRLGQPDDIGDAILFLASPAARWVNGRTIIVDGGLI